MNVIRALRGAMQRAVKSKIFFTAVMLVVILRLLDILPLILQSAIWIDGELKFAYSTQGFINLYGSSIFGMIILIVPVLPYSCTFCNDYSSNYLIYYLLNIGKTKYSTVTVITCAISSFLSVVVGDILAAAILSPFTMWGPVNQSFESTLIWIILRITLYGLQGAFYGVITMLLSIFTSNEFVIYTSPILLYYFISFLGSEVLKLSTKIVPTYIFKDFIFGEGSEEISLLYSLLYLIAVIFVTVRCMEKKIERCF